MLCSTQQPMITSDRFSILWSRQFRTHVHLALKITKARTNTLAEEKNLFNFFYSWDKCKLSGNVFTSQVFAGYAPSPIRRDLILYPSITSVGSVSKMLRSAWIYNAESLRIRAIWILPLLYRFYNMCNKLYFFHFLDLFYNIKYFPSNQPHGCLFHIYLVFVY